MVALLSWMRVSGMLCIALGLLIGVNAILSGATAFGSGIVGVVAMVVAGIISVLCGCWVVWKHN